MLPSHDVSLDSFSFNEAPQLLQTISNSQHKLKHIKVTSKLSKRQRICAFSSMTMQNTAANQATGTKNPIFVIASAVESSKSFPQIDHNAPQWRITAGNLLAGAVAGISVEAVLYPIDTIKTRLQAAVGGGGFKALIESGGGRGLYAGVLGNLAGVAPSSALFMAVYEPTKQKVAKMVSDDQAYLAPLAAGAVGGLVSSLTRVPTEVIKQRLQTKEFPGAISAIRNILAREGLRGFFSGYGAFLLRDLPFDAIEFGTYEQLKRIWSRAAKRDLHPGETSLIGAFAGGFTGLVTTPLDVLKTRLMTQGSSGRYANIIDCTIQIAKQEGAAAFMRGWQPRVIWISLGGLVFFPVLEASKRFFAPKVPEVVLPVEPLVVEAPSSTLKSKSKP